MSRASGVALILAAAMLWGTTGTAQAFSSGQLSPVWVGALRLASAAAFFWVMLAVRSALSSGQRRAPGRERRPCSNVIGRERPPWRALLTAALAMTCYNLSFFVGVKLVGVGVGTALTIGSGPIWAGLLAWGVLRRAPSWAWWLGTALSVTGAALLLAGEGSAMTFSVFGVGACLLAGLSYAGFALSNKALVSVAEPLAVTARVFSIAAVAAVLLALPIAGALSLPLEDIPVMLHLGVVATGVAYWLFAVGLRHVGGATAVTLALAEPLTAFVLAVTLLGEAMLLPAIVGMGLLLAGLAIVVRQEAQA